MSSGCWWSPCFRRLGRAGARKSTRGGTWSSGVVCGAHRLCLAATTSGLSAVATVYWYFVRWEKQRVTLRMLDALRQQVRQVDGRDRQPSAGIIDSQSVKAADTVGRATRGYDAGKKVAGRKRFIITDTLGLLLTVTVCTASIQDRDGAKTALFGVYLTAPRCRFIFADAGFSGRLVDWAHDVLATTLDIVRKPVGQKGFAVLPRRWAVERTWPG